MNTTNWEQYYSIDPQGWPSPTGAIYEPLVNEDGSVLCLNFNNNSYRSFAVSEELLDACFFREKRFLERFQKYNWCAKILEIDSPSRKIFIEWNVECCEKSIMLGKTLPENYVEQLETLSRDMRKESVYKVSMYPCYHYVKDGVIKTFGFYTSSDYSEQPMDIELYRPILSEPRAKFADSIMINGKLDFAVFNEYNFLNFIKWPGDPLPSIYKKVYADF